MPNDFAITVCSLPDYENLVAEIYYQGVFVGLLSQEEGLTTMTFEPSANLEGAKIKLDLKEFVGALERAAARLRRLDSKEE